MRRSVQARLPAACRMVSIATIPFECMQQGTHETPMVVQFTIVTTLRLIAVRCAASFWYTVKKHNTFMSSTYAGI